MSPDAVSFGSPALADLPIVWPLSERMLLTIPQAAIILGIGQTKLYELLAQGAVESVSIGRAKRIPREALEAYVRRLRGQAD